jgi:hypothetical protein
VWRIRKSSCQVLRKLADYCLSFLSNSLWRNNNTSIDGTYTIYKGGGPMTLFQSKI